MARPNPLRDARAPTGVGLKVSLGTWGRKRQIMGGNDDDFKLVPTDWLQSSKLIYSQSFQVWQLQRDIVVSHTYLVSEVGS